MTAILIDSDIMFVRQLEGMLNKLRTGISINAVLSTVEESLSWFKSNPVPDIIISEVSLADGMAFEIFEKTDIQCPVIFISSDDEHVFKAFRYNTIHYLLKPISEDVLNEVLIKYETLKQKWDVSQLITQLVDLRENERASYSPRLFITREDTVVPISTEHISCIKTAEKMVVCYINDGRSITRTEKMNAISKKLNPLSFKRISRQWIINISSIKKLSCGSMGNGHIIMEPSIDIEVSREKYFQIIKDVLK